MNKAFWAVFCLLFLVGLMTAITARQGLDIPFAHRFIERIPLQSGDKLASRDSANAAAPSGAANITTKVTRNITTDHSAEDARVCGRPRTKSRTDTGNMVVYRWTDDEGVTHMADQAPAHSIATVLDISGSRRDFTYRIEEHGVKLPMQFSGQIAAGSKRIFDIWHFLLGEERLKQVEITVQLLAVEQFDLLWAAQSSLTAPVSGFYTMSSNTAHVRYDPERQAAAIATSFHEISHLVTASHLGVTPPWLNEGLAEYAETMQVTDQKATISPNQQHLRLLRSASLPTITEFLSMDRAAWSSSQIALNYAIAWSLIHHLMSTDIGRTAIRAVIREASDRFCKPFSAKAALASAYPGGLPHLESDWRERIRNGRFDIHQT